jgi:hypothetical protein
MPVLSAPCTRLIAERRILIKALAHKLAITRQPSAHDLDKQRAMKEYEALQRAVVVLEDRIESCLDKHYNK